MKDEGQGRRHEGNEVLEIRDKECRIRKKE
jgi:hypothetical protein